MSKREGERQRDRERKRGRERERERKVKTETDQEIDRESSHTIGRLPIYIYQYAIMSE